MNCLEWKKAGSLRSCSNRYAADTRASCVRRCFWSCTHGGKLSVTINFFFYDDSSTSKRGINQVATAKFTLGCNPPQNDPYCPAHLVTRGQMAAFIDVDRVTPGKSPSRASRKAEDISRTGRDSAIVLAVCLAS